MFEQFDMFSMPITLRFNSRTSYSTSQGGCFSIFAIALISMLVVFKASYANSVMDLTDSGAMGVLSRGRMYDLVDLPFLTFKNNETRDIV